MPSRSAGTRAGRGGGVALQERRQPRREGRCAFEEARAGEERPADQRGEQGRSQEQHPGRARDGGEAPQADRRPSRRVVRGEVPGELGRADLRRCLIQVRPQGGGEVELEAIAISHRRAPS